VSPSSFHRLKDHLWSRGADREASLEADTTATCDGPRTHVGREGSRSGRVRDVRSHFPVVWRYTSSVAKAAESVVLDDDVKEELRKLAERSGRPLDVLANAALRDYVRYESQVGASIERGIADVEVGRVRSTDDVLAYLEEQRRLRSR
jgi:predicted transcriptional regulator